MRGPRTDEDVLPKLTRRQVRLAHLRICHAARDEQEQPLARFGRRTGRARGAMPARLCAPQRGRRCWRRPRAGGGERGLRIVLDVGEAGRVEPAVDVVLQPSTGVVSNHERRDTEAYLDDRA